MQSLKSFFIGSLLWIAIASAASEIAGDHGIKSTSTSCEPIPPSKDPWYSAPQGFEHTPPGTVLRIRPAPGNLTSITANCSEVLNLLYRTTDSNDNPTWAVTTLFIPSINSITRKEIGHALLSWAIPYDSDSIDSSPSFLLYQPSQAPYLRPVTDGLSQGWYVSVPDYEGPLAAFTAGIQSGYAMIDSIRAVKQAASLHHSFKLSSHVATAMWGYSGGAIACEWAAELQPTYATELHFSGAAIGGLTPSVPIVLTQVTGTQFAGLIPTALLGITVQHLAARQVLVSSLKTSGQFNSSGFLAARQMTFAEVIETYAGQDVLQYFIQGVKILDEPAISHVMLQDGTMGLHGVPRLPLFVYEAIADEVSPISQTDALVSKFCSKNVKILYERNMAGEHISELTNGYARALAWLKSVFDGSLNQTSCVTRDVNITDPTGPITPI